MPPMAISMRNSAFSRTVWSASSFAGTAARHASSASSAATAPAQHHPANASAAHFFMPHLLNGAILRRRQNADKR